MAINSRPVPLTVARHLLPHEHEVIVTRLHPVIFIKPLLAAGISLIGVAIVSIATGIIWPWLAFLAVLVWLAVKVLVWRDEFLVVTSQRLLLRTGLVTTSLSMIPLGKVTDISFNRSLGGRLLGYGEIVVEAVGQEHAMRNIRYLPYPEQLYLEICGLIFRDSGDAA